MNIWVSLDMDCISGDNRKSDPEDMYKCVWNCECCKHLPRGRASVVPFYDMENAYRKVMESLEDISFDRILVRECHASIYKYLQYKDVVFNLDEHDDDCPDDVLCCGSWVDYAIFKKSCYVMRDFNFYNNSVKRTLLDFDIKEYGSMNLFISESPNYTHPSVDKYLPKILKHYKKGLVDYNLEVK